MKNLRAMIRMARTAAASATFLGLLMAPAGAMADGSQKLTVRATIAKHASLKVLAQPSAVVVTSADIARGYVDVPAPAQLAIRSNSQSGYLLEFTSEGDFMRQILVKGLASDVQLSPAGGTITQASTGSGVTNTTLALGFRFLLADSTKQGTYPWPMRVSITAL
jgi:hypothetical protein